ncbi:MAG TPA: threonine transporter [Thermoanaerobaculia bacterium]|nr:threonine transporter [Thermoanaerobaculia bacterium]
MLQALKPTEADLQRLVYFDYLCLHTGDAGGPPSLHPALPQRSGEWLVRRVMLSRGVDLLFAKELLEKQAGTSGITYRATELTEAFLGHLSSSYAKELLERANWVALKFGRYEDEELASYMRAHVREWGAEFARESLFVTVRL